MGFWGDLGDATLTWSTGGLNKAVPALWNEAKATDAGIKGGGSSGYTPTAPVKNPGAGTPGGAVAPGYGYPLQPKTTNTPATTAVPLMKPQSGGLTAPKVDPNNPDKLGASAYEVGVNNNLTPFYGDPWATEQAYGGMDWEDPLATESYWKQAQGQDPNLMMDPDLGAYYERAKKQTANSIAQSMAALGAYGSSATMDAQNNAFANLDAERANREAEYQLERSRHMLDWTMGQGSLASDADAARAQRMDAIMAGAQDADAIRGARGEGFFGNLMDSSGFRQDRLNDVFEQNLAWNDMVQKVLSGNYGDAMDADQANAEGQITGQVAAGTERTNRSDKDKADNWTTYDTVAGAIIPNYKAPDRYGDRGR